MLANPLVYQLLLPASAGVITHWSLSVCEPKDISGPALLLVAEPFLLHTLSSWSSSTPLTWLSFGISYTVFIAALMTSMVTYRLSPFHPLSDIPGPRLAKITKFWGAHLTWTGRQHLHLKALHDKYGPFVRTGPNEVSIADADAVTSVLGSQGLPKGRYYDARQDPTAPRNLIVLRGEEHAVRRRLWNRGMSSQSLDEYEGLIAIRANELLDRIGRLEGPVDISKWLSYFSFDFMGDMAFGCGFNMIRDGEDKNGLWKALEDFMFSAAVISHVPWVSRVVQRVPYVARGLTTLRKHGVECASRRIKSGATIKDLWYHLTDEAGLEKEQPDFANVVADGTVAIVAGADTVATVIMCLFYYLLSNPNVYERLRQEIDTTYPRGEDALDTSKHASLTYLSACIHETLRILPPVPTNGSRRLPAGSGGKVISGRLIPENTEVYVPAFSIHRNPRYFSPCPEKFWPDRWLLKEHLDSMDPNAFIPFSYGPANCVGRNLAKREIMMVTSLLLQTFDLRFADGFDPTGWEEQLHDHLVLTRAPLPVVLTRRQ
ncbi:hypothetical protein ONZ45_g11411 [Pleurotus djamor]|nr:hypothetical protein ONZ45_g11411 [Pleurotus djamor]